MNGFYLGVLGICLLLGCPMGVDLANSYVYLGDKMIKEEIPLFSFVADLAQELEATRHNEAQETKFFVNQQFTLLEDSKSASGAVFFELNATSGVLSTRRPIDREAMCLGRHCSEACGDRESQMDSCKINLKVLTTPSYDILSLNIFIEDINDNRPQFRSASSQHEISENVPLGYKIPIDMAYDPDAPRNSIQRYEIIGASPADTITLVRRSFRMAYSIEEAQLHLVVTAKLDRENISEYKFTIGAFDGGRPSLSASLNVTLLILDVNDNNPVFEKDYYRFTVAENAPVDSVLGQIKAHDKDADLNGLVKYSFVDNSNALAPNSRFVIQKGSVHTKQQNFFKYFELNEMTGILRLKVPLDFEDERHFSLTVEAKDSGVGSLPSFSVVDVSIEDVNDNAPDISVSFLNSLPKNASSVSTGSKYDIYLPEHSKSNKFLAHVSISDRDSGENGRVDWEMLVNDKAHSSSRDGDKSSSDSLLKLVRLKNNSFTLNVGNSALLDRESNPRINASIKAWDYGSPSLEPAFYNFSLVLIDINDQAPRFDETVYQVSVPENNLPGEIVLKVHATDTDLGANAQVLYSIQEPAMRDLLEIDPESGVIRSKMSLDRESVDQLIVHIEARDHGQPPLSSSVRLILNVLDLNDNSPIITFNTSYYHRYEAQSLFLRLGRNLALNAALVDFRGEDRDLGDNSRLEFALEDSSGTLSLSSEGRLSLVAPLERASLEARIVCHDFGRNPNRLNSTLRISVQVVETTEYCIKIKNVENSRVKFVNRDDILSWKAAQQEIRLFAFDLTLLERGELEEEATGLEVDLLNHQEMVEARWSGPKEGERNLFRVEMGLKRGLNATRIMLGKYTVKVKLTDKLHPTCSKIELFTVLVGNSLINEREIGNFLQVIKSKGKNSTKKVEPEESGKEDADYEDRQSTRLLQVSPNEQSKQRPALMKSDYVLLFILIVIILVTGVLLAFIGAICLCAKYNKQYQLSKKSNRRKSVAAESESRLAARYFGKKSRAKKVFADTDLNSSTSSKDSQSLSGKPQYSLVSNNTSSSSNATSNGTLTFDDEAPIVNVGSIRQLPRPTNQTKHVRYVYATNPDINFGYESNRSNSAAESIVDSLIVDDTKSNSSNNDFDIIASKNTTIRKLQGYKTEHSSAYSSITHSDNTARCEHETQIGKVSESF